jgi:hypothetical protein
MDYIPDVYPEVAEPAAPLQTGLEIISARLHDRLAVAYAASIELDFADERTRVVAALTGNLAFTAINYQPGRLLVLWLDGGTGGTLTLPATWLDDGTIPGSLAASAIGRLTVYSSGTTEAEARASYTAFS